MGKVSKLLALLGLALFTVSFLPWPAGSGLETNLSPALPTPDLVAQGAALFRGKGCVACHRHDAVDAVGNVGPDLTHYNPDPVFLRRWLLDPAAVRPDATMPDLDLQPAEIESLIAFLQQEPGEPQSNVPPKISGGEAAGVMPVSKVRAELPATCPLTTQPQQPFTPPAPYPPNAPYAGQFWYGTEALWTMLPADGRWDQLAHGEKVWWWRAGYDGTEEPQPELQVTARRLDGKARVAQSGPPATNGYHRDFHWAMLTGLEVAGSGCWEITGRYQGEELTFVVSVAP